MTDANRLTYAECLARGRSLLGKHDHRGALAVAEALLGDYDASPDTYLFAGEVHFYRGNYFGTEEMAAKCIAEFPDAVAGPILRCRALMAMGKQADARELALEMAERDDVTDERHVDILVTILAGSLAAEAAYRLSKKALERDPYNPAAHRRVALNARLVGRLGEAKDAANVALRFEPHDYEMLGLRSSVATATEAENHIAELESLLAAGCRDDQGAARVAYAAAKECEEVGRYERAFEHLTAGATFKRRSFGVSVDNDFGVFEELARRFDRDALAASADGHRSREPIFILGLPRTGSTLIERILSSHPDVYAAGELMHFDIALMTEVRKLGPLKDRREIVQRCFEIDPEAVGRNYIERTRPYTGHTKHFIDKRPLNFLSLGAISMALPDATVIHVTRSPMDTCYAIYKFLFNEAYPWSYDLEDIAHYYVAYRKLMAHWRSVLPPGYLNDIGYEDVVADLPAAAERLAGLVGLEAHPAMLEFHRNPTAAMTGSAAQVRRQIYSTSVGRWQNYETQLQPVADILTAAGVDPYSA